MKVNDVGTVQPNQSSNRAGTMPLEGMEWLGLQNGPCLQISRAKTFRRNSIEDEDTLLSLSCKRPGKRDGVFFETPEFYRNQVYDRHHRHVLDLSVPM